MRRIFLASLFTVFLIGGSPGRPVLAGEGEVQRETRKLEQLRSRIQDLLGSLKQKEKQRGGLEGQLRKVEKALGQQNRKIRKLARQRKTERRNLLELRKQKNQLQDDLQQQQVKLAAQLRSAYFTGGQEHFKLLLNQQDPSALARVLKYYEYLNKARLEVIENTLSTLESLKAVELSIEEKTQQLDALKQQYETERSVFMRQREERKQVLKQITAQISENQQTVSKLRQDEKRIEDLIASLSGLFADIPDREENLLSFAGKKGRLSWPAKGNLLNRFGQSRAAGDLLWQGIRIAAPSGSEVQAVSHGRVAFADWLPGFGLILILDHNKGYMSLYGHNEALYKETGDWVDSGEVIASIGDSGGEQDTALYFEIRHKGKPVDPLQWFRQLSKAR